MSDFTTRYTRPVSAGLTGRIENRIPHHCRSVAVSTVTPADGIGDATMVRYSAHYSEIAAVRRAIRSAKLAASVAHIR